MNEDEFDEIYRRWAQPVYRFLQNYADPEEAKDLLQQVFVKVWKKQKAFRGDSSFKTWVFRIARNQGIDFVRKKKRRREEIGVTLEPAYEQEYKEFELLHRKLSMLKSEHSEILRLHYFEELNLEEISKILRRPLGTVKSRLHRAREELKQKGF